MTIVGLSGLAALHAIVAGIYAALAAIILFRQGQSPAGRWFGLACCITAAWATVVAASPQAPLIWTAGWLELARSAGWYYFVLHLYRRTVSGSRHLAQAFGAMGLLAIVLIAAPPLCELLAGHENTELGSTLMAARLSLAVCSILLLENLYLNTPPDGRWHMNLLCIGLGGLFCYDLLLYADGLLYRQVSRGLVEGRAAATAMVAPLLALSAARYRRWKIDIHVSRSVVFHSATLIGSGVFLLSVVVAGELFRRTGSDWGYVVEVALVFGSLLATAVLVTSSSARSWLRTTVVDHFFTHRYDYRREWMRCIDTLTAPEAHVGLHKRAIRAVAEVVDSPAGALFVRPPQEVAFQWAGSWNMPAAVLPIPPGHPVAAGFRDGDWTVLLDETTQISDCFEERPRTWLAVPLNHSGSLIGFVVLAPSRAKFKLDREVFQLLRVVGREVASRVAEQRAAHILSQTTQLREYSQRFAFVIHDIKNVSGQLSMLLTNAEVHADNPKFQRDMLATVRASVGKITRLLSRLQAETHERDHALIVPAERLSDLIEAARLACEASMHTCEVSISLIDDGAGDGVAIEPDAFDAVVTHLLNNAVEAGNGQPVCVSLQHDALNVLIDITDKGQGMTPEFIRDELFQPFATTKGGGHGIGAYQARELLREAGGDLLVISRPGVGTTMRLLLPRVHTAVAVSAAV
jgi:putative PEP-CTERM system histidine kinase